LTYISTFCTAGVDIDSGQYCLSVFQKKINAGIMWATCWLLL